MSCNRVHNMPICIVHRHTVYAASGGGWLAARIAAFSSLRKSPRRCFSTDATWTGRRSVSHSNRYLFPRYSYPLRNCLSHQRYPSFSAPPVVRSGDWSHWTVSAGLSEGLPFPCPHVSTTRSHRQPRKRNARCFVRAANTSQRQVIGRVSTTPNLTYRRLGASPLSDTLRTPGLSLMTGLRPPQVMRHLSPTAGAQSHACVIMENFQTDAPPLDDIAPKSTNAAYRKAKFRHSFAFPMCKSFQSCRVKGT